LTIRTLFQALVLAAIFFIVMTRSCQGDDVLLHSSWPVQQDPTLIVATYYRNQSNFYYFTIVYRHNTGVRYLTNIRFTLEGASYQHSVSEKWIDFMYHHCQLNHIPLPIEDRVVVPFSLPAPAPLTAKDEEVYIIYPNKN
jgi:hypothetical protein